MFQLKFNLNAHVIIVVLNVNHQTTFCSTDTVVFDNSYSFIRSKKLAYNIQVTLPVKEQTTETINKLIDVEE